jgi:hypothetical protein
MGSWVSAQVQWVSGRVRYPLTYGQIDQLAFGSGDAKGIDALNRFYDWRRGAAAGLAKGLAAVAATVFTGFLAEIVKAIPNGAHPASVGADAAVVAVSAGFAVAAGCVSIVVAGLEQQYLADHGTLMVLEQRHKVP